MIVSRSPRTERAACVLLSIITTLFFAASAFGQTQATAADLSGTVTDPNGAVVGGATVTARNSATGISRTVTADGEGRFQIIGLPPGEYQVSAEAATFKKVVINNVRLTVGQAADLTIKLELGTPSAVVNVSADDVLLVDTTRTAVSNTIDQQRIENLPINERSATGFALTLSTVNRDNGRPIGPAPTSGLNIGGQRGRSTQVNVDGADFTDNSINAAHDRIDGSRAGIPDRVELVHARVRPCDGRRHQCRDQARNERISRDVFGFIRDKNIQARNPFAPVDKPDFRRTQFGGTFGGPIKREKSFFFLSYEGRKRDESGFFTSDVVGPLTASATIPAIGPEPDGADVQ